MALRVRRSADPKKARSAYAQFYGPNLSWRERLKPCDIVLVRTDVSERHGKPAYELLHPPNRTYAGFGRR